MPIEDSNCSLNCPCRTQRIDDSGFFSVLVDVTTTEKALWIYVSTTASVLHKALITFCESRGIHQRCPGVFDGLELLPKADVLQAWAEQQQDETISRAMDFLSKGVLRNCELLRKFDLEWLRHEGYLNDTTARIYKKADILADIDTLEDVLDGEYYPQAERLHPWTEPLSKALSAAIEENSINQVQDSLSKGANVNGLVKK